ncbi:unnamed protein product [Menidia menidia]|uniref:(Atlantic silverside) hypothetical protein n=1 Tax=Menidia menidia TaxID=238744 RepID=A0A8S4AJU6_9TELE|nr:unnamed protein product [Menidia menidia]
MYEKQREEKLGADKGPSACSKRIKKIHGDVLQGFSWAPLAWPSFACRSTGRSKNPTTAGSLSRDARTCSKEKDQSASGRSGLPWETEASSAEDSPAVEGLEGPLLSGGLLGSCSLLPTSSILSRRLVTWATARYSNSSSGSPWKML